MDTLALTDRDGLYGAVKFVLACRAAGVAPVLGVDLAVEPTGLLAGLPVWADPTARLIPGRTPVRGGATVDPRFPRVTVLARGTDLAAGLDPGAGWGRLCRLVSDTHLRGERGRPMATLESVAAHSSGPPGGPGALVVLLGPDSEVGRAVLARRPDVARAVLTRWAAALPPGALVVEVVCHHGPSGGPASVGHAARMLELAREAGVPAVLTNAVRYVDPSGAATADVLDAARRLVPLDERHLDRVSAEGHLASPGRMAAVAREVARAAGDPSAAASLLATTEAVAARCRLDPQGDLGVDSVHLPENYVLGLDEQAEADIRLRKACESEIDHCYPGAARQREITDRLDDELETIRKLGFASYFLTVQDVCRIIKGLGVRVAARGSGAGSLVNYLLGISGVDPLRYGLLMERFLTPLRIALPDIDLDVESARRTEVYEAILERFGAERVACVSMMDTYRVRHAIRDVGAALGLPPGEIDVIAKSFPHIRARDVRHALVELPELRASGIASERLAVLYDLVERLDGLPRHVALHPCGVLISDAGLLDRTPVEASWLGFPMSQFDKDDVEQMGLLKLDVLGIRMQSAMAYAIDEVARVDGPQAAVAGEHAPGAPYLDEATGRIDLDAVPHDDDATFRVIRTAHTLGCFQIESPGQRELVGKFGPETFLDLVIDISLFRPGPVKSDMVTPFLRARQGWDTTDHLHPRLEKALAPTGGVVVFHEQVLQIIDEMTGCGLAQADEVRRTLGSREGQLEVEQWFRPLACAQGFDEATVDRVWEVLEAFASFGFCKAHAASFALPTYHSAWLKAHHPAAFLAGVLTHDPGMYPKRLILDDARNVGISILPLDVNRSDDHYRVERLPEPTEVDHPGPGLPDGRPYGIRLSLTDVKGISDAEVARIVAGRLYHSLSDFWQRSGVSRPVLERLIVTGGFDSLYALDADLPVRRRDRVTRRDLLLQAAELDRWNRATTRGLPRSRSRSRNQPGPGAERERAGPEQAGPGAEVAVGPQGGTVGGRDVRAAAARQSRAPLAVVEADRRPVQLALDLGDAPAATGPTPGPRRCPAGCRR